MKYMINTKADRAVENSSNTSMIYAILQWQCFNVNVFKGHREVLPFYSLVNIQIGIDDKAPWQVPVKV